MQRSLAEAFSRGAVQRCHFAAPFRGASAEPARAGRGALASAAVSSRIASGLALASAQPSVFSAPPGVVLRAVILQNPFDLAATAVRCRGVRSRAPFPAFFGARSARALAAASGCDAPVAAR